MSEDEERKGFPGLHLHCNREVVLVLALLLLQGCLPSRNHEAGLVKLLRNSLN